MCHSLINTQIHTVFSNSMLLKCAFLKYASKFSLSSAYKFCNKSRTESINHRQCVSNRCIITLISRSTVYKILHVTSQPCG